MSARSFADRLAEIEKEQKGTRSERDFARSLGVEPGTYRSLKTGTNPRLDTLMSIAKGARVSVGWLAAEEEPKVPTQMQSQSMSLGPPVDAELLREIIEIVEKALTAQRKTLPAAKKAEVIALSYSFCVEEAALSGSEAKEIAPRVLEPFLKLVA